MNPAPSGRKTMGILAVPVKRYENAHSETLVYSLIIGHYEKGMAAQGILFLSSPAIRAIIQGRNIPPRHIVGRVETYVSHEFRTVSTSDYHPITDRQFSQMGVADLFDLQLERAWHKKYPNYRFTLSSEPSAPRMNQMVKRGRPLGEFVPLSEAVKQTRKRVIDNHQRSKNPVQRRRPR